MTVPRSLGALSVAAKINLIPCSRIYTCPLFVPTT